MFDQNQSEVKPTNELAQSKSSPTTCTFSYTSDITTSTYEQQQQASTSTNLKSNKPPAHIKDLIFYKYQAANAAGSASMIPSVTVQPSPSQISNQLLSVESTEHLSASKGNNNISSSINSLKYTETLSPSNLSNSPPPLGAGSSFLCKLNSFGNLNDSQSSVSSTTSNLNCDAAKIQQQQQIKKTTGKKKTAQMTNDLDEERTSQLVSDIIKNIKEKTKELENQNLNLKNPLGSSQEISTSVLPPTTSGPAVAVTTLNAATATSSAATTATTLGKANANVCFSLIQPLNKIGLGNTSIFTQIHPLETPSSHFQLIPPNLDSSSSLSSSSSSSPTPAQLKLEFTTESPSKTTEAPKTEAAVPKKPCHSSLTKMPSIRRRHKPVSVPLGWSRVLRMSAESKEKRILYQSPTGVELKSMPEIKAYLLSEATCKCGLQCPLNIYETFNFNLNYTTTKLATSRRNAAEDHEDSLNHSCACQNYLSSACELEKLVRRRSSKATATRGEKLRKSGGKVLDNVLNQTKADGESAGDVVAAAVVKRPSSANNTSKKICSGLSLSAAVALSPSLSDPNSQGYYFSVQQQQQQQQSQQPILLSRYLSAPSQSVINISFQSQSDSTFYLRCEQDVNPSMHQPTRTKKQV